MERHLLSKSTFIRAHQCKKSLYLHKKRPFLRDKLSAEQRAKFERGSRVGEMARELFPGGVNLAPKSPSQSQQAVMRTREAIQRGEEIIYEASFQFDRVLVIMDVLTLKDGKYYAYEVKSSKKISETYLLDAALQYYVISQSGIDLEDISIIHVDPEYEMEGKLELNKLFKIESVKEQVLQMQEQVADEINASKEILKLKKSPPIDIGPHCYDPYPCDFIGHCWKHIKEHSVFELLHLDPKQQFDLYARGKTYISELDPDALSREGKIEYEGHKQDTRHYNWKVINQYRSASKYEYYVAKVLFVRPAVPGFLHPRPYQLLPAMVLIQDDKGKERLRWTMDAERDNFDQIESFWMSAVQDNIPVFSFVEDLYQQEYLQRHLGNKLYNYYELFSDLHYFDARLAGNLSAYNLADTILEKNPFAFKDMPDEKVASIQLSKALFLPNGDGKSNKKDKAAEFITQYLEFEDLLIAHVDQLI